MTLNLHGDPGWIVLLLAILGAMHILTGIENWIRERVSLDLHLLWHVIPRRFRVSVRWDRPGATVRMDDGREGAIITVIEGGGDALPIALVQPYDEDGAADQLYPGWHVVGSLSPVRRLSFRHTLRALRSTEHGGGS